MKQCLGSDPWVRSLVTNRGRQNLQNSHTCYLSVQLQVADAAAVTLVVALWSPALHSSQLQRLEDVQVPGGRRGR